MLISLHLPKTAGTSFKASLEEVYKKKLLYDYKDRPRNTPPYLRHKNALEASLKNTDRDYRNIECIHGHFLPLKYLLLGNIMDVRYITWMRNPVERAFSHYYYWKRNYNPKNAPLLQKQMIQENWSFEKFAFNEGIQNLYTQFLWAFPMEQFSFIGITEFYNEDFEYFSKKILNIELKAHKLNVNTSTNYDIDVSLREKLELFHDKDMYLYRKALDLRLKRL